MKVILRWAVVWFAASGLAEAPNSAPSPSLERWCGKLEHVQNLPVKDAPNAFVTKQRDLRRGRVSLYPAGENSQCWEGAAAMATAVTGNRGCCELKSKHLPGGLYGLQVEPNGRKYRVLIHYAQKRFSDQLCSQPVWEASESGDFRKAQLISVD
jgi:hypothetical protein